MRLFYIHLLAGLLLIGTLYSCDSNYPQELTLADSLLMRGDYQSADSLLAVYDRHASSRKSAQMYRQLLYFGRQFTDGNLTADDFSMVDSLCRYYDKQGTQSQYSKALCFLGEVYKLAGDNPSALATFLKGIKVAENCNDNYTLCWLCQLIGDLYFDQQMLRECVNYYRCYYDIAVSHRDTLRMAFAANRMGKVYTIYNNVDSTIYFYKKAILLAQQTSHPENIIPYCKYSLSDIYIQIEEFDKAKVLMTHDSLDDANWAYWHLRQHHTDSAICYFEKFNTRYGLPAHATAFRYLAQLEESRGNQQKALQYYKRLPAIEDSIKEQSQEEEIRRVHAQFNLNLIKQERDEVARHSQVVDIILLYILILLFLGSIASYYTLKYYRQKKNTELFQEKLLRKAEEDKYKQSVAQIEDNKREIAKLKEQLSDARKRNDSEAASRIELDTMLLTVETQSIEIQQRRRKYLLSQLRESSLYIRIMLHAGEEKFHLTDDEWQQLAQSIDEVFNNFTHRLFVLVELTDIELKVCYLIKIGVTPTAISTMLYKSKTAISMIRQRLYKKITNKVGTPKQLDDFILSF